VRTAPIPFVSKPNALTFRVVVIVFFNSVEMPFRLSVQCIQTQVYTMKVSVAAKPGKKLLIEIVIKRREQMNV